MGGKVQQQKQHVLFSSTRLLAPLENLINRSAMINYNQSTCNQDNRRHA